MHMQEVLPAGQPDEGVDNDDVQQPVPAAVPAVTPLPRFEDVVSADEGVDNDESGVWHYGRSN